MADVLLGGKAFNQKYLLVIEQLNQLFDLSRDLGHVELWASTEANQGLDLRWDLRVFHYFN